MRDGPSSHLWLTIAHCEACDGAGTVAPSVKSSLLRRTRPLCRVFLLPLGERRIDFLTAVADALDNCTDHVRAHTKLPCHVVNFVRLFSRHPRAVRFATL